DYIPYVVQGVYRAGQGGIGTGKGRFSLLEVSETNPFTIEKAVLYTNRSFLQPAKYSILSDDVEIAAKQLDLNRIGLHFLTPMQITAKGNTLQTFDFCAWIARLMER